MVRLFQRLRKGDAAVRGPKGRPAGDTWAAEAADELRRAAERANRTSSTPSDTGAAPERLADEAVEEMMGEWPAADAPDQPGTVEEEPVPAARKPARAKAAPKAPRTGSRTVKPAARARGGAAGSGGRVPKASTKAAAPKATSTKGTTAKAASTKGTTAKAASTKGTTAKGASTKASTKAAAPKAPAKPAARSAKPAARAATRKPASGAGAGRRTRATS